MSDSGRPRRRATVCSNPPTDYLPHIRLRRVPISVHFGSCGSDPLDREESRLGKEFTKWRVGVGRERKLEMIGSGRLDPVTVRRVYCVRLPVPGFVEDFQSLLLIPVVSESEVHDVPTWAPREPSVSGKGPGSPSHPSSQVADDGRAAFRPPLSFRYPSGSTILLRLVFDPFSTQGGRRFVGVGVGFSLRRGFERGKDYECFVRGTSLLLLQCQHLRVCKMNLKKIFPCFLNRKGSLNESRTSLQRTDILRLFLGKRNVP